MLEILLELMKAHRRAAVILLGVSLALTGLSVARCSLVNSTDAPAESAARAAHRKSSGKKKGESGARKSLTARQDDLIASYSSEEKSFVSVLESCTWASTDGEGTLTFDGGSIIVNKGAKSESETTYAVLEIPDVLSETTDTESKSAALVLDDDGDVHVIRMTKVYTDTGTEIRVESDMFEGKVYTNRNAAKTLEIEGLDSKRLVRALGGDAKAIEKTVRAWCVEHSSTAIKATWTGIITSDVTEGTESATFSISTADDSDADYQSALGLVYDTKAGTLSVAAE